MNSCLEPTEYFVKLIELWKTANQLDQNVHALEQLSLHQSQAAQSIHEKLKSNLGSLKDVIGSLQASSDKLVENSTTLLEWLGKEPIISELFQNSSKEIQSVWKEIRDISPSILNMLESIASIDTIFDLLHTLAINTAIQAAKLGEKGRAFTIISKEMRRLADKSRSFIDAVKSHADSITARLKILQQHLTCANESYTNLETTMQKFLSDSLLIKDNTGTVTKVISQYQGLSQRQIEEWKDSLVGSARLGRNRSAGALQFCRVPCAAH
ncbi:MAG: methyl-accepting chemotaxis protein, partial [Termitinemataceae bacterium]